MLNVIEKKSGIQMKINTHLNKEIYVNKYSHDIIEDYELSESTPWLQEILTELEEDTDEDYPREKAALNLKATITRKSDRFLGDILILRSHAEGHYNLPCGRCLYPIKQAIHLDLNAAFLNESKEELPEYAECTTVFADGEEMELYFYRKGIAEISSFYHEQFFSEVVPFPRCEGDCKGKIYF